MFFQSPPQELQQQLQEEAKRDVVKATGHTESGKKKGFGKTEDADIGLKEQYKCAAPLWKFDPVTQFIFLAINLKFRLSSKQYVRASIVFTA